MTELGADQKFTHVFNLAYYRPKLWEYLFLIFRPLECHNDGKVILWYKTIGKRFYLVAHGHFVTGEEDQHKHEGHLRLDQPNTKDDNGFNSPWVN